MEPENNSKSPSIGEELIKEQQIVEAIAVGFEEMPILSRLAYVSQIFDRQAHPNEQEPWQVPLELQVAANVLVQVIKVLQKSPTAASLTENLASELERSQPGRPAMMVFLDQSDGPPR